MSPKFTPTVDPQKGERYVDDRLLSVCLHHHSRYQFDHDYDGESIERFWTKYQTPAESSEMQDSEGADDAKPKKRELEDTAQKGEGGDFAEMRAGK